MLSTQNIDMVYTLEQYANAFPRNNKTYSVETIRRLIHSKQLPTNHVAIKGKQWIICVDENNLNELTKACLTFHLKKKYHPSNLIELANTIAMKHNLESQTFKTILGI